MPLSKTTLPHVCPLSRALSCAPVFLDRTIRAAGPLSIGKSMTTPNLDSEWPNELRPVSAPGFVEGCRLERRYIPVKCRLARSRR